MNIFLVILVVLLAFSVGLNIGRLATLWQLGEKERNDCHNQGRNSNDRIDDIK